MREDSSLKVISTKSSYIPGIDALRALAVTSVIVYHLHERWLPGGFVGVDIFFAISGYLITKTLLEHKWSGARGFLIGFYRRRFLRIAPALFVYIATVAALSAYFIPRSYLGQGIQTTAKWAIFGASNIQLVMSSDGYFGDRMHYNPFLHTWSLGVEEQFYLIYPMILLLVGIGLQRSSRLLETVGKAILAVGTVGSLVFCMWQTHADPLRSFYLLPARFWELAAGALLYLLVSRVDGHRLKNPALNRPFFIVGLGLIGCSLVFATMAKFPFWWALPAVLGGLALIHVANNVPPGLVGRTRVSLTSAPVLFIGRISYSLYLWHWGIFVLMRWTIGLESLWTKILALVLTVLAGWLSYAFVESLPRRTLTVKFRIVLAAALAVVLAGLLSFKSVPSVTAWAVRYHEQQIVPGFRDNQAIQAMLDSVPQNSVGHGHKVMFVGDSHAGHFSYMAKWTALKTDASYVVAERHGCSFVNLAHAAPATCPSDQTVIDKIKLATSPGDIVVLSSFTVPPTAQLWGPLDKQALLTELESQQGKQDRADALARSLESVRTLQDAGLTVILAAPTPVFETPPDRCQRWFNRHNPVCAAGFTTDRAYQLDLRAPVMQSYKTLSAETGAMLWDPFVIMCPADPCQSEVNNRFTYTDQHHISANGNLVVFRSFLKVVESIWDRASGHVTMAPL